jgi:23S rRNA pseudouridine1911/1915/1917 synthase
MPACEISISAAEAGQTILSVLGARLVNESKTRLRRLIAEGVIRVNGKAVATVARLREGDVVELPAGLDTGPPRQPTITLDVLHEDEDHIVLNKPPGLPVLPARDGSGRELYEALAWRFNRCAPAGGPYQRPHVVHRLDKDTSGVLLVARTERAGRALSMQFQRRMVRKTYLVIVEGVLPRPEVHVDVPIRRVSAAALRMVPDERAGKPSRTLFVLRETFGHFSLVEARPHTGRQHQIRVHLSAIGYPPAVDAVYGRRGRMMGADLNEIIRARRSAPHMIVMSRCPLHAARIAYLHPSSGQPMEFDAPMPDDMREFIELLRRVDPPSSDEPTKVA